MPLPTPNTDESRDDFIGRCMRNEMAMEDFPDQRQRLAVCFRQFRDARENAEAEGALTYDGETYDIAELARAARDAVTKNYRFARTTVRDFHWHPFDDGAEFTGPPSGIEDGHRHRILRDDEGLVTGFEESAGHTHGMPPENEPPSRNEGAEEDMAQHPDKRKRRRHMTETGWTPEDRWADTGAIHPEQAFRVAEFGAAESDPELFDLKGVEIFRVGTWNGDKYTRADLDDMVANFERVGFRPPVKLGHREASGAPANGWVRAIRRVGDALVADLMDLPKQIYEAVKTRRFDAVSSEVFWNLKRGGRTFKRALKAIALLGAETPAVSGLKPLRESFSQRELSAAHFYGVDDMPDDDKQDLEVLREELEALRAQNAELQEKTKAAEHSDDAAVKMKAMRDEIEELKRQNADNQERARREQIRHKCEALKVPVYRDHLEALYDLATRAKGHEELRVVKFSSEDEDGHKIPRDTDPVAVIDDLVVRLNKVAQGVFLREHTTLGDEMAAMDAAGGYDVSQDPGVQIDDQVQEYMTKHNESDYQRALEHVLAKPSNRELKIAYLGRHRRAM